MDNNKAVKEQAVLESERESNVEQIWQYIERFVLPFTGIFYKETRSEHDVDWRKRGLYSGVAPQAAQGLAAAIHGNITSPATKWFDLSFKNRKLNSDQVAKEWLQECGDLVWRVFTDSNFNGEIAQAYLDLVGYGTCALVQEMDEDKKEIVFQAVPIHEIYFQPAFDGSTLRFYRKLEMTAGQMVDKFGDDVPDTIKERADDPEAMTQRMSVLFCVFKRDVDEEVDPTKPLAPTARPWGYRYILKDDAESLGVEGGYYESPVYIGRWRKTSGSKWGHSPAMVCLSDIMTLNEIIEVGLEVLAKEADPTILTTQRGLMSELDLQRGGLTVVQSLDDIRVLETGTKKNEIRAEIARLSEDIRRAFHEDDLALKESPQMTATEVNVRYELMQRMLGPSLGRVQTDILDPLIENTFSALSRMGQLPEMPDAVKEAGGDVDIEYTGPLPRSQKADTAMAIQSWLQMVAELSPVKQEALDIPDFDEALREIATLRGVPARLTNSNEDTKAIRDTRQKQQKQTQQLAMAEQMGKAAGGLGSGMKDMATAQSMEG